MSTWIPSGPDPSERDPQRVSESLDRLARRLGGPSSDVASVVFVSWPEVVGAEIAAHARPVSLRGGVLVLAVDSPVWAAQLRYMTGDLLRRLSDTRAGDEVREIRIHVSGEAEARTRTRGRRPAPS